MILTRQQRFEDRFEALSKNIIRSVTEGCDTVSSRLEAIEARMGSLESRMSGVEKIVTRFSNDSLLFAQQIETAHTGADAAHQRLDALSATREQ